MVGRIPKEPTSEVHLTWHDGALHGTVARYREGQHLEYRVLSDGALMVRELDAAAMKAACGNPGFSADSAALDRVSEQVFGADLPIQSESEISEDTAGYTTIDVLVGYGAGARQDYGGTAGIEAHIINAVDRMNTAFTNSAITNTEIMLLGMIEDPAYTYRGTTSGTMAGTATNPDELFHLNTTSDGVLDAVSDYSSQLGADLKAFIIRDIDGSAGVAFNPGSSSVTAATYMTTVRITFAHEIGHNLGADHSWGDSSQSYHSRYGWRLDPPDATRVRTIMAYDWSWGNGHRIPYYANPDVFYLDAPTGIYDGVNVSGVGTSDQRYVTGGLGYNGSDSNKSGFDGTNSALGARNAHLIRDGGSDFRYGAGYASNRDARTNLAVLDPSSGDSWDGGSTYSITWRGGDYEDTVSIDLIRNGSVDSAIASGINGATKQYSWTIPYAQATDSTYRVRVTIDGGASADSSTFSITAGNSPPSIAVVRPVGATARIPSNVGLLLDTTVTDLEDSYTSTWSIVSGDGTPSWDSTTTDDTGVTFSADGNYVLRLTVDDGNTVVTEDIQVEVGAAVDAGLPDPSNPYLYYAFDEGSGSTAADSAGSNNGTLNGAIEWVTGKRGDALDMDLSAGSGQFEEVRTANSVNVTASSSWSASAWVKLDSTPSENALVLQQGNTVSGTGRSWLAVTPSLSLYSYVGNGATEGGTLTLGQWHLVGISMGGGTITLYLDGEAVATRSANLEAAHGIFHIGNHKSPTDAKQWDGLIDDVAIYNRALAEGEFATLAGEAVSSNVGPQVDAGSALAGAGSLNLDGTVTDDGQGGGSLTQVWTQRSGPGTVTFGDDSAVDTSASSTALGAHVLRLSADDGSVTTFDQVTATFDNLSRVIRMTIIDGFGWIMSPGPVNATPTPSGDEEVFDPVDESLDQELTVSPAESG